MKITKLLVLGALLLVGNSVAKAADWIARTAPTVSDVKAEPVTFEADHEYLLYNTGAKMFFSQGNAWGTRASGDAHQEHALRMYFTKYVPEAGEWDGKTYIFKIYSSVRSNTSYAWRDCFFDSNTAMFVDRASQANFYWEIQDMGGAIYRLKAAQANPDHKSDGTQFVGRDESVEHDGSNLSDDVYDPEAQPLSPLLTEGEGKHIDWVFYDAAVFSVYDKAEELRTLVTSITEKELGKDFAVDSYVALYNNSETTGAEFQTAIEDVTIWGQYVTIVESALEASANEQFEQEYRESLSDYEMDLSDNLKAHSLTKEELHALIDEIQKAIDECYRHPRANADMTSLLQNPNFDQGGDDNFPGWTAEYNKGGGAARIANSCAEFWNATSFDLYQVIEDAPKGVYEISVQGFYRYLREANAWNAFKNGEQYTTKETIPVYIYMNDNKTPFTNIFDDPARDILQTSTDIYGDHDDYASQEDGDITYYFPNNMPSSSDCFREGMYTQKAAGLVAADGDVLRLGVIGSSNQGGDSWVIFDNFKLTYKGFDAEVIQPVLQENLDKALKALDGALGKDVAESLKTVVLKGEEAVKGGDGEAMFQALVELFATNNAVEASKAKFAELVKANETLATESNSSETVCSKETLAEARVLATTIAAGIENQEYNDADVEGLLKQISDMRAKLRVPENISGASDANPVDCTSMIVNSKYNGDSVEGWTTETGTAGAQYTICEVYNSNFDHYQVIEELPVGIYTATVQGFYRYGFADVDYKAYTEDAEANNNLIFYVTADANDYEVKMPRLASVAEQYTAEVNEGAFSAGTDWIFAVADSVLVYNSDSTTVTGPRVPNMRSTASELFASENGKKLIASVTFKVGEDGKARIGLKKEEEKNTDGSWCTMNEWTLTYYGPNSTKTPTETGIKDAADKAAVVKTELFNVSGARVNNAAKGIIIVKETLSNGAIKVKKVTVK